MAKVGDSEQGKYNTREQHSKRVASFVCNKLAADGISQVILAICSFGELFDNEQ